MRRLILTDRLRTIADQVRSPGFNVADIGTDHGYVPVRLLQSGHCGRVILSDINAGPLKKAEESFRKYLPGVQPDIRQGPGLSTLKKGEADAVIIAGIGGNLTIDILSDDIETAGSVSEIILQPGRHVNKVRRWLRESGALFAFRTVRQIPVREGRRFSEIIVLLRGELLEERDYELINDCKELKASVSFKLDERYEQDILDEIPVMYAVIHNRGYIRDGGADVPGFIDLKILLEERILENIDKNGISREAEIRRQAARARLDGFRRLKGMLV